MGTKIALSDLTDLARLPGARRKAIADVAAAEGVETPQGLLDELRVLAG